jgi:hypothetical protein
MFAGALVDLSGDDFNLRAITRLHRFGDDRRFQDILKQRAHRFIFLDAFGVGGLSQMTR